MQGFSIGLNLCSGATGKMIGSYAKDTCTADSDYDFYIIMPDEGGVAGEGLYFMERDALVKEWFRYARMDIASAKVLMETMYPAPLEIFVITVSRLPKRF